MVASGGPLPTGLLNPSNTCYLNSVLQTLAASRPLQDALADYPNAEKALQRARAGSAASEKSELGSEGDGETADTRASTVPLGTPTTETSPALKLFSEPESRPVQSESLPL